MQTHALHRLLRGDQARAKSRAVPLAMAIGLVLWSVAPAYALELPPLLGNGNVTYVTGGIGEDEASAMKAAARQFPLEILLVENRSDSTSRAYSADNEIAVLDAHGNVVLYTSSDGPYLLVDLPPGHYTVVAEDQGRYQKKNATVSPGAHQQIVFQWEGGQ